jgi:hypothetical protein
MGYAIIMASFIIAGLASLAAAITGYRGKVCERGIGYELPARVAMDQALAKQANDLVAFWCLGAAILSVLPLIYLYAIRGQGAEAIPTIHLVGFTFYGFILICMATYPFEKIKRLGEGSSTDSP